MPIGPGTRIGPYEVTALLGEGGMGRVWRARHLLLKRDDALKVLPEGFDADPGRLARFRREAEVLASLNHPHIAQIHGLEDAGGSSALVMELVEGPTLEDRLVHGPLPVDETLSIASQIAEALEAAHERGIVHRDLKPSNIKVRPDGTVKVLDFGLARSIDSALIAGGAESTKTLTSTGVTVGTPAYMSPEQASGEAGDQRTDVWAFGCVLYEMLAGRRAFEGTTRSEILAAVLSSTPDWSGLPASVPSTVRVLLRRCLARDLRERPRHMSAVRLLLEEREMLSSGGGPGVSMDRSRGRRRLAIVAVTSAVAAAAGGTAVWLGMRPDSVESVATPRVTRFSIEEPESRVGLAISADGTTLAYITGRGLVVRPRDRLDSTLVAARSIVQGMPFLSPDGEWVGFAGWDALRKVPTAGGPIVMLADGHSAAFGTWAGDDIVFCDTRGLFRVPAAGGEAVPVLAGDRLEQCVSPQMLRTRQAVLFTVIPTRTQQVHAAAGVPGARIEALDLPSGQRRVVLRGAARARYVPTGHLLYVAGATLYAVAFDLERLETRGDAISVVTAGGFLQFDVSDDGTLIYQASGTPQPNELVWVDRQGREEPLRAPARAYLYPRVSPDGTRVALDVADPEDRDVWVWDLRRSTLERFTRDPAGNPLVAWSRDGRYLAFGSERSGVSNLFGQAADGSGEAERLLESDTLQMPISFAPDGRLLFSANVAGQQRDIHVMSLDGTHRAEPLIHGPANELWAEVSPNGRWVAYDSDESGQFEVYVRPYPDAYRGGRWQISSGGGRQPLWSRDGKELFYRDFSGAVMALPVTLDPTFAPGRAVILFRGPYAGGGAAGGGRTYDVSPDGRRFLMIKVGSADRPPAPLVVVLNWFDELRRLVPAR